MDPMDIDSIVVLDTPDRLAARQSKFKNCINILDTPDRPAVGDNFKSGIGRGSNDKDRFGIRANENGSRNLFMRPPRRHHVDCSDSSFVSKRHDPSHASSHNLSTKKSESYVHREASVEDLTDQHCHGNKGKKVVSSGGSQIVENRKRLLSDKGNSRLESRINNGKGNIYTVSGFDCGKGVESNALTPPKVGRQKRLVRNGCISPCNVAKAQKDFGKVKNGTIDEGPSHVSSSHTADAQASNVSKGKGIIPLPNEEPGVQNANDRDSVSINEILEENGDSNRGTIFGGWRSTHNRSKKTYPSSSESHQLLPVDRSLNLSSNENPLPLSQRPNVLRSPSNQHNGDHPGTNMVRKRQKLGSSSSIQSADSGIILIGSSGDTVEPRRTRSRKRNNMDNVARVIEIGEGNSGVRSNGSNGASSSNNVDPDMARQMEADEKLARELQEQLYHEDLSVRSGEVDVHERLDLQHENVQRVLPRRTRQASTTRSVSTTNPPSRPPTRVPPSRNVSLTGNEIPGRPRTVLYRFPGRHRTLSSSSYREGSSLFPPEIDADLRMSLLETLFNNVGVDNNLAGIHREFNENDYEMLLRLDENNDRHSGRASTNRINDLPQTTLENDNLEEACAICLETPTTGDTIRHLPCFHKFHKDCIDPWLRRKSSCPVCKHSIT